MGEQLDKSIHYTLKEFTGGKPFVFVIMPYKDEKTGTDKNKTLFETIQNIIKTEFAVECYRADKVPKDNRGLLAKIHDLIEHAELVIAECSDERANVFYELGYALGVGKHPLLLLKKGCDLPYDLRGQEVFEYEDTLDGFRPLKNELTERLRFCFKPKLTVIRDMLKPKKKEPSYIVTSPKYPGKYSYFRGHVCAGRTFGDHLGIRGIFSAFGAMYGEIHGVEMVSPEYTANDLHEQDYNLYLIGSRKNNHFTGKMLELIQQDHWPKWSFRPHPDWGKGEKGDWPVTFFRKDDESSEWKHLCGELKGESKERIWTSDYGLVIRGPHPKYRDRLVVIMAGPHTLGTSAACLAATSSGLLQKLRMKLAKNVFEDRTNTIWALVKGIVNPEDNLLDEEGVTIEDAGGD